MILPPEEPQPVNWYWIDQILLQKHGITPVQADQMTLSEIALAVEDPEPRPAPDVMGWLDIDERTEGQQLRWARMSPRERLEAIQRRRHGSR